MPTVRLIYASRFSRGVGPNDIPDILAVSREKNAAAGVTGILCYDPRYFLQVLEGPRKVVNALYNQIANDERHADVTLIEYSDINERLFANWTMAFVRVDDLGNPFMLKHSSNGVFDPFAMSGEQALDFVCTVRELRPQGLDERA